MHRTATLRALAAIGTAAVATMAFTAPALAKSDAPAGNNGTIKIDDVAMDDGNENNPHPGCTFVVDFFGYDVGTRVATLDFDGQAPTGGGQLLTDTFTFDVASRESGNQLDASRTVDLTDALAGIEPHPQQGWHVKLTVHVDGSQGSDVKHKVFWISDCEGAAAPAEEGTPPVDMPDAPEEEASPPAEEASVPDVESDTEAAVLAEQTERWMHALEANAAASEAAQPESAALAAEATAPAAAAPAGSLPRTGVASDLLTILGIALIATGFVLVQLARRRRPAHAA